MKYTRLQTSIWFKWNWYLVYYWNPSVTNTVLLPHSVPAAAACPPRPPCRDQTCGVGGAGVLSGTTWNSIQSVDNDQRPTRSLENMFVSCCVRQIRVGFLLVSRLKADSDRRVSAVSIIKSVFQYYVKCVLCVSRCGLLMLKMLKVKKNQEKHCWFLSFHGQFGEIVELEAAEDVNDRNLQHEEKLTSC